MAYPGLENVSLNNTKDIITYPLSGDGFFYNNILIALWVIFTLTLFFRDNERLGVSNFLSALAVSSFAIVILAYLASLLELISETQQIIFISLGILFIAIWFFNDR